MKNRQVQSVCFSMLICFGVSFAQIMSIDTDPVKAGVQSKDTLDLLKDTIIAVDILGSHFSNVFSYELKMEFDTAKLEYLQCESDYGFLGAKNIMKKNGGSVQGLCQPQINPKSDQIIDFAFTITGPNRMLACDGDGLLGVGYFKVKMKHPDSCSVALIHGRLLDFDGTATNIDTFFAGKYYTAKRVGSYFNLNRITTSNHYHESLLSIVYEGNSPGLEYRIPETSSHMPAKATLKLFSPTGKIIKILVNEEKECGTYTYFISTSTLSSGMYICCLETAGIQKSVPLYVP